MGSRLLVVRRLRAKAGPRSGRSARAATLRVPTRLKVRSTFRRLVALGVERGPELKQAFPLERRQLLPRLPLVHRELVLDHVLGEGLVPRAAADPVLAGAHDVDAAALAGRRGGRCGRTAGELLGEAPDLE